MDNTLINSHIYPYSAEKIFSKYSDADALARWWGPHGNTNTFDSFDFTEGGKWVFTMHTGEAAYPNEWIFRKIEKKHILMDHTVAPYFSLEVLLEEIGENETRMIWNSVWESPELLVQLKDFLIEKNNENFERLGDELKNF